MFFIRGTHTSLVFRCTPHADSLSLSSMRTQSGRGIFQENEMYKKQSFYFLTKKTSIFLHNLIKNLLNLVFLLKPPCLTVKFKKLNPYRTHCKKLYKICCENSTKCPFLEYLIFLAKSIQSFHIQTASHKLHNHKFILSQTLFTVKFSNKKTAR